MDKLIGVVFFLVITGAVLYIALVVMNLVSSYDEGDHYDGF